MIRRLTPLVVLLTFTLSLSMASGEQRGRGGESSGGQKSGGEKSGGEKSGGERSGGASSSADKSGSKPPGGAWSSGKKPTSGQGGGQASDDKRNSSNATGAEGAAAANRNKSSNPTGAEGAAAANRNQPNASGAEGAAAGAAASNRNQPNASGAQGAAAGAAASNRNQPAASGAEGAAFGAAASNRNQPAMSGAEGAAFGAAANNNNQPAMSGAAGYAATRDSFDHSNLYSPGWHGDNQGAWAAPRWQANAAYNNSTHAAVAAHCGYNAGAAVSYGYGDNVNYENEAVVVNGQVVGSAPAFSQQAADLANTGRNTETTPTDEWLPLGVFALVPSEGQQPQLTVQLAINKQGILRGNYTELVSDHTQLIHGMVNKETQRAAWTVGDTEAFYMEAGLKNLTAGDAPVLIHRRGRTERWVLVTLPQPQSGSNAPDGTGTGN